MLFTQSIIVLPFESFGKFFQQNILLEVILLNKIIVFRQAKGQLKK